MTLDIKSVEIKPIRETFGHVQRRIGVGKTATRYEEATYDLQPTANFHYRPTYNPKYKLYDKDKTAIKMEDWYKLLDPRQYHYASYVTARAKQQEVAEQNFIFIDKRNLLDSMPEEIKEQILKHVLPLRHYEWGANLNNLQLVSEGYGAAMTSAAMFHTEDRLGNAQYITKNALLITQNETEALDNSKELWLNEPSWQPLRKVMENSFVLEDWFELHLAQNMIMDSFIHPLFFNSYEEELNAKGGNIQTMMTEFITIWYEESSKWVDKTIEIACQESNENSQLLSLWAKKYICAMEEAILPLAKNLVENPEETVSTLKQNLINRLNKLGLKV
jgi:phenol hydroxylase P1 protein